MNYSQKFLSLAALSASLLSNPVVAADQYNIDSGHTLVAFELDHLGFSKSLGWVGDVSGTIVYDSADASNSSVNVTMATDSVITNHEERDGWIKSDKVLNTVVQPVMTFVSTLIAADSGTISKIVGDLTMNGVSKPVELDVTFNGLGQNPISKKDTIGFSATATIKRSEWGVTAFVGPIGDDVSIQIELEALKAE